MSHSPQSLTIQYYQNFLDVVPLVMHNQLLIFPTELIKTTFAEQQLYFSPPKKNDESTNLQVNWLPQHFTLEQLALELSYQSDEFASLPSPFLKALLLDYILLHRKKNNAQIPGPLHPILMFPGTNQHLKRIFGQFKNEGINNLDFLNESIAEAHSPIIQELSEIFQSWQQLMASLNIREVNDLLQVTPSEIEQWLSQKSFTSIALIGFYKFSFAEKMFIEKLPQFLPTTLFWKYCLPNETNILQQYYSGYNFNSVSTQPPKNAICSAHYFTTSDQEITFWSQQVEIIKQKGWPKITFITNTSNSHLKQLQHVLQKNGHQIISNLPLAMAQHPFIKVLKSISEIFLTDFQSQTVLKFFKQLINLDKTFHRRFIQNFFDLENIIREYGVRKSIESWSVLLEKSPQLPFKASQKKIIAELIPFLQKINHIFNSEQSPEQFRDEYLALLKDFRIIAFINRKLVNNNSNQSGSDLNYNLELKTVFKEFCLRLDEIERISRRLQMNKMSGLTYLTLLSEQIEELRLPEKKIRNQMDLRNSKINQSFFVEIIDFQQALSLQEGMIGIPFFLEENIPSSQKDSFLIPEEVRKSLKNLGYTSFDNIYRTEELFFLLQSLLVNPQNNVVITWFLKVMTKKTIADTRPSHFLSRLNLTPQAGDHLISPPPELNSIMQNYQPTQQIKEAFTYRILNPSAIDVYLKCPYRFYLEKILGYQEINQDTLEPNPFSSGRLLHKVLELFYAQHNGWALLNNEALAQETIKNIIDRVSHEFLPTIDDLKKKYYQKIVNRLEKTLVNVIDSEIRSYKQAPSLRPHAFEKEIKGFILPNSNYTDFTLSIGWPDIPPNERYTEEAIKIFWQQNQFPFMLVIDRIDFDKNQNLYKIIDYKSSQWGCSSLAEIKNGASLQLPFYYFALSALPEFSQAQCAGLTYFNLKDAEEKKGIFTFSAIEKGYFRDVNNPNPRSHIKDEDFTSFMQGQKLIFLNVLKNLLEGDISVSPQNPDVCMQCSFANSCKIKNISPAIAHEEEI